MKILLPFLLFISLNTFATDIQKILNKAESLYAENPAESFAMYEKAEKEALKQNNTQFECQINLGKARYYLLISKYESASALLNECILRSENTEDHSSLTHALSLKGILLERVGEKEASHALQLEVLELNRQHADTFAIINSLNNLSLNYLEFDDPDSMKIILEQLDEHLPNFDEFDYYYYNQNWGSYFVLIEDFQRGIHHYQSALKIAEKQKMIDSKATVMMLIAKAYEGLGQMADARIWAEKSYVFSEENNLIYESYEALEAWISIEKLAKNYKKALELQDGWIRLDREINDIEKLQKVNAIESQLKLLEKEKLFAESQANLQAEKLSSQKERTKNAWLTAVVFLIVALLIFVAVIYRKTKILNSTISEQKKEVELKSMKLEEALESIEDSLTYSKLIQNSLLPSIETISKGFEKADVYYLPKDFVSGDFYWCADIPAGRLIAVGDCTGHGVPGAMVSIVCQEALNKVVKEMEIHAPGRILDEVKKLVSATFSSKSANLKDGMDIALMLIDDSGLTFAGANNPVWIFRESQNELPNIKNRFKIDEQLHLIELKADKQPIGTTHQTQPFEELHVDLKKGDYIVLLSDGYADQFGGDKGKKLKSANLKGLIRRIIDNQMDVSRQLAENFAHWKGELEQVDDVCVLGLKVKS